MRPELNAKLMACANLRRLIVYRILGGTVNPTPINILQAREELRNLAST